MSEEANTPAILSALVGVMDEVRSIDKAGSMSIAGSSYRFRRADDVMNAIGEAFRSHGVMLQSQVLHSEHEHYETSKMVAFKGKEELKTTHWTQTYLTIRYTFTSLVDGSGLAAEGIGEGLDSGDKSSSKAMTGALKYALTQALQIAFKDMADPDNERPETQGDEPETDAQRILRERRGGAPKTQASPAAPEPIAEPARLADDSATVAAAKAQAEQVNQAEAARMAVQAQMKADAEQGSGASQEPAAGVELLKTELGAREINIDTPEAREQLAQDALGAASKVLTEMKRSGSDWPKVTKAELDSMRAAVDVAENGPKDASGQRVGIPSRDLVNKVIIRAGEMGLLVKLYEDNSLGKKLYVLQNLHPVAQS